MIATSSTTMLLRPISASQLAAVRTIMQLFIDEDLTNGVSLSQRLLCHGCRLPCSMAGFLQYERYQLCNGCATEYEVARMRGVVASIGQYVREKQFSEAGRRALEALLLDAMPAEAC